MRRTLPLLLLLPTLVLAQSAPPRQSPPDFGKIKQTMLPMLQKSLPQMRQTLDCVKASGNSEQLSGCAREMAEFSRRMAIQAGVPADKLKQPPADAMKIEWSKEMQAKIVADIEKAIAQSEAMKGCLEASSDNRQMGDCMRKSGVSVH